MNKHLDWEKNWWGDCCSTLSEEQKQLVYARHMGLSFVNFGPGPRIDLQGKSILDIGGGPVSLLLKTDNKGPVYVVDPCEYPNWVKERYEESGIGYSKIGGEDFKMFFTRVFDEVWIYNCLQHVDNPRKIIKDALSVCRILRIFEWIDIPKTIGHPHELKEKKLNKWLGGIGQTKQLNESGCIGTAYFGVFKGEYYEEV